VEVKEWWHFADFSDLSHPPNGAKARTTRDSVDFKFSAEMIMLDKGTIIGAYFEVNRINL
jgi:hypothetical protein